MRRLVPILCASLAAAGCGAARQASPPPPKLPHALAQRLAQESDAVAAALAAGDPCRARQLATQLRADATASIGRVPARFQDPLSSGVNEVVDAVPQCVPPPSPAPIPAPPSGDQGPRAHGHDHGHGHGHGHGHEGD